MVPIDTILVPIDTILPIGQRPDEVKLPDLRSYRDLVVV